MVASRLAEICWIGTVDPKLRMNSLRPWLEGPEGIDSGIDYKALSPIKELSRL